MFKRFLALSVIFILSVGSLPAAGASPPMVSARSAIVISADTGSVLSEYNPHLRLPMASTTKIMTALLLAEAGAPETTIVTTKEMVTVEGSSMGLMEGDTVTYRDLLYGMLLASGNDAANTTAIALGGSVAGFAEMMNRRAAEIGMTETHFVTPSGLDDEEHYTTAYDMALLAACAMNNPVFREAASSKTAFLYYGNPPYKRTLSNHNRLLSSYDGCIGVKTGFTKKSGRCLVSAAERGGAVLIAVTLNDGNDWEDHTALLDYGFSILETVTVPSGAPTTADLLGGAAPSVSIGCEEASFSLPAGDRDKVETKVFLDRNIFAPVTEDEIVGRVDYIIGERVIKTTPITIKETVDAVEPHSVKKDLFYYLKLLLSFR